MPEELGLGPLTGEELQAGSPSRRELASTAPAFRCPNYFHVPAMGIFLGHRGHEKPWPQELQPNAMIATQKCFLMHLFNKLSEDCGVDTLFGRCPELGLSS